MARKAEVVESTEIVPIVPAELPAAQIWFGPLVVAEPEDVLVRAQQIAATLSKIIKKQRLFKTIGEKEYVFVEGWVIAASMLNMRVQEVPGATRLVQELDKETWEAACELVNNATGERVGYGTAVCSRYESKWANRDNYALRSMSITRAAGKACRLRLSWIMNLAGFSPTPAEEMTANDDEMNETTLERAKDTHPVAVAASMDSGNGKEKPKRFTRDALIKWTVSFAKNIDLTYSQEQLGQMIAAALKAKEIEFDSSEEADIKQAVMDHFKSVKAMLIANAKAETA